MTRIVPSPQALRHLARICSTTSLAPSRAPLCAATSTTLPSPRHPSTRRNLTTSRPSNQQPTSASSSSSSTSTTTTTERPFTTTSPDTTNHYTLFPTTLADGPPPTGPFNIPLPQLRREFLQLQSLHHPDKHPPSTPQHKHALALSALINNAYITLSSPLLRAQYLLSRFHDIDVTSEDNSANVTDQGTLMEVMEAQEAVEEAQREEEVEALKGENAVRIGEAEEKMGVAFEKGDVEAAKKECLRLKYWVSLEQVLRDWEPGKEVRLVH